jgi:hypothetical protein
MMPFRLSEERTGAVRRIRRVTEPVTHGDDAFHVPDGVDDVEAGPGGLGRALDGDDAVLDGDGEPVGVE